MRGWGSGCTCADHRRRLFTGALLGVGLGAALPAAATIPECKRSGFTKAVSADQVEAGASQQYRQMLQKAGSERALAPADHPQLQRLRYIAERIIPFTPECNERARQWRWEVNLIGQRTINAFCMPGGKIAFYYGILAELQLDDDEVAMIMGHEAAHALLEHAREQMGKNVVTTGFLRLGAAALGLGQLGDMGAQIGAQLLQLKYSRDDETEADQLGLLMAAKAGYDPRKGVSLWQKMSAAGGGAPPAMLSTHPSGPQRIQDIQGRLPVVLPQWEGAAKPPRRFNPPDKLPPAKPRG
ncbi:MAG: M48 family metallopeptidase [Rubrivivax sp.]|jgi:Zn-dependent protease with chaperone function|nr:M48 family metallopeptidase [Rubrivivax sp.]